MFGTRPSANWTVLVNSCSSPITKNKVNIARATRTHMQKYLEIKISIFFSKNQKVFSFVLQNKCVLIWAMRHGCVQLSYNYEAVHRKLQYTCNITWTSLHPVPGVPAHLCTVLNFSRVHIKEQTDFCKKCSDSISVVTNYIYGQYME